MYGLINIVKEGKNLKVKNYGGYESRNQSSIKLASQMLKSLDKDIEFNIYTEDRPIKNINNIKTFSYSTIDDGYSCTCPDFIFENWREVGINNYNETCDLNYKSGLESYQTCKIGWIGSFTNNLRKEFYNFSLNNNDILDVRITNFSKNVDGSVTSNNFLTMQQQIKLWKYLIDIEGNGYSGRMKLLMHSGRPLFLVERPYKEYFYQFLIPWKHYIPVKRDFSDLKSNLNILEKDTSLYDIISKESINFAKKYLSKEYALEYWKNNL